MNRCLATRRRTSRRELPLLAALLPLCLAFSLLPSRPAAAGPMAPASASPAPGRGRFEVTLFTPDRREHTPADNKLLDELQQLGFRVDRQLGKSNPEPNVKVARGHKEIAQQVLAVVSRYYEGTFEVREIFAEDSPDVFVNLGSAAELTAQPAAPALPATSPPQHTVVIFTPQDRDFGPADRQVIDELDRLGFKVQATPGGGGSNPDSSVKVGRGNQAIGEKVQAIVRRCYEQPFPVRDIFEAGDTDIYVNLGQDDRPSPACGAEAPEARRGATAGDSGVVGGLGSRGPSGGTAIDRAAFRVVLLTPGSRAFGPAERALLADLRALRFRVDGSPGRGGSTPDSNVKVGRGNARLGAVVQSLAGLCFDGAFPILESFESASQEIFVDLGDHAVTRPECSGGQAGQPAAAATARTGPGPGMHQRSYYEVTLFTPDSRAYTDTDRQLMDEFARLGYRVDRTPLSSNPTANIKVGSGELELAGEIHAVLGRFYSQQFEILEVFEKGDKDIFINLGGGAGDDGASAAPEGGSRGTADAEEAPPATEQGEEGQPPAPLQAQGTEQPAQFRVTVFTPQSRELNASDRKILGLLKEQGFRVVEDRSGGGGTNDRSNVKFGKGRSKIGKMVRETAQRCYNQAFELLEVFDASDGDVYINLGADADSKVKCGKTSL